MRGNHHSQLDMYQVNKKMGMSMVVTREMGGLGGQVDTGQQGLDMAHTEYKVAIVVVVLRMGQAWVVELHIRVCLGDMVSSMV